MSLKELTPDHMRCHIGESCHAVFETDDGDLVIIGKKADDIAAANSLQIADDEFAIVIDPAILANLAIW